MIDGKKEKINNCKKQVNLILKDSDCCKILDKVFKQSDSDIIEEIKKSGLRGRGGAGFPTGMKWEIAAKYDNDTKYVICNADEGEPGTFKDREILEKQPIKIFTGMAIGAKVIGAKKGYLYLRGEYEYLMPKLKENLDKFNDCMKGKNIDFKINIVLGAGAYICGEETSLLESMEGKRGEVRNKPPYPVEKGYLGKPTIINNVETFVYAMIIMDIGADKFSQMGTADSKGSKLFSVSGDTDVPGIYELELGMTLKEFVELFGSDDTKAVQVGGASGFCVARKDFEKTIIGFEGIPTGGSMILFNTSRSMYNVLHNFLDFFEEESCGQCTPCRVGCQQLLKGLKAIKTGEKTVEYLNDLKKLTNTMALASKCGLGQSVPNAFCSIVDNFKEEIVY